MPFGLDRMLPLLRCPVSGSALTKEGDELVSREGCRYPIINGKPVLVRHIRALHTTSPDPAHISRTIDEFTVDSSYGGPVLNLGSGNVPSSDPRVISLDILPAENVDLVAEAENLPFATGTFELVCSGAVFEHVHDPLAAAAEVRRVLRDGGSFYIDTAFLQGYHGFPSHFFNMTSQAVETYLVGDFVLEHSVVPDSGSPTMAVSMLLRRYLDALGAAERYRLEQMTVAEALAAMDAGRVWADMTEHDRRSLAASLVVVGRKPNGYDGPRKPVAEHIVRDYYAARALVIARHHECETYRPRSRADAPGHGQLREALAAGAVLNPLSEEAFTLATEHLNAEERRLRGIRDRLVAGL